MEITGVDLTPIVAETGRQVSGSNYTKKQKATLVVTVDTDADVRGQIYSGILMDLDLDYGRRMIEVIDAELAPVVVGEDLSSIDRLWHRMFEQTAKLKRYHGTQRCIHIAGIAAVDLALWDALGKATGSPLHELWGGARESIPVISIGGYYEEGRGVADIAEEIGRHEAMDVAGVKFKVGGRTVTEDVERVRAAREAASDDFEVAVDANQGYSIEEAIEFAGQIDGMEVLWFEEPVVWYDQYEGMRTIRERFEVPVVAGQSEIVSKGCKRLIESGSVDVLNYDSTVGGGATPWKRVAGLAAAHGVPMGHHHSTQVATQLLATVDDDSYVEIFEPDLDPFWYELVENTPDVRDGEMAVPDGPGFGLDLDQRFIERHEISLE